MKFIGQNHIMSQLKFILPSLYENPEHGVNILIRGPSGYGKTTMALAICRYLAGNGFQTYLGNGSELLLKSRVVFVDEVHRVDYLESMYHEMDSRRHVLVFATNVDSTLPEAFVNRCYQFILTDYSDEELLLITMDACRFRTSEESYMKIIEAGNRNPRIIKSLCERLDIYFSQNSDISSSSADFNSILQDVFQLKDGLDTLCRRYLEILERIGGSASIDTLKHLLHVDQGTLTREVEPVLLKKGIIKITSRGRSMVYDNV